VRAAIVGAGFSGIATAIALKREGVEEITIFERAGDVGGVWFHNTYPGACCDVPSYVYSFSYEQRRDWSRPCSPQEEIHQYLRGVVRKYGLAGMLRFETEVTDAAFDEGAQVWRLRTAAGDEHEAELLVVACGQLSRPRTPSIPGAEDFAGHAFHSAAWDHGYDLRGRRVAVIGTGASAVQFVPEIAQEVAHLDVYQRTAPYMLPRRNPTYPGWLRALIRHVPGVQAARRIAMWLFMESLTFGLTRFRPALASARLWSATFMRMQVRDPELRRRIRPDYPFGCKRILFSSNYLPALQRPNVDLVTDRIARISERGVVTEDGREREADCIIYGTGFRADEFVLPMEVTGRGGVELQQAWAAGAEAHLGITIAGFPNMFLLYGPNTNLGAGSIVMMIEAQAGYVAQAVRALRESGAAALDLRPEVQAASGAEVQERLRETVWGECQSWYRRDGTGRVTNNWPGLVTEYLRATRRLELADYELLPARSPDFAIP
jgi:cation diffusion facilitator CzcD-associated flavoprotein CzcO